MKLSSEILGKSENSSDRRYQARAERSDSHIVAAISDVKHHFLFFFFSSLRTESTLFFAAIKIRGIYRRSKERYGTTGSWISTRTALRFRVRSALQVRLTATRLTGPVVCRVVFRIARVVRTGEHANSCVLLSRISTRSLRIRKKYTRPRVNYD